MAVYSGPYILGFTRVVRTGPEGGVSQITKVVAVDPNYALEDAMTYWFGEPEDRVVGYDEDGEMVVEFQMKMCDDDVWASFSTLPSTDELLSGDRIKLPVDDNGDPYPVSDDIAHLAVQAVWPDPGSVAVGMTVSGPNGPFSLVVPSLHRFNEELNGIGDARDPFDDSLLFSPQTADLIKTAVAHMQETFRKGGLPSAMYTGGVRTPEFDIEINIIFVRRQ